MSTLSSTIIVNASPLLALDACNQINILRSLYIRIVVPDVVDKELSAGGVRPMLLGGLTAAHRGWIEVLPLSAPPKASLTAQLDPGEAAVIQLAMELGTSLVLIDERIAWKVAQGEGMTPVGSVGVLLLAKKKGLIVEVKPHLYEMRAKGIYLSQRVIDAAVRQAGEMP